jgi:hypothetical protein
MICVDPIIHERKQRKPNERAIHEQEIAEEPAKFGQELAMEWAKREQKLTEWQLATRVRLQKLTEWHLETRVKREQQIAAKQAIREQHEHQITAKQAIREQHEQQITEQQIAAEQVVRTKRIAADRATPQKDRQHSVASTSAALPIELTQWALSYDSRPIIYQVRLT